MQHIGDSIWLSATDLANYFACRRLSALNKAAAQSKISPPVRNDPHIEALQQRGFEHERAYLEHLSRSVLGLDGRPLDSCRRQRMGFQARKMEDEDGMSAA